MLIDSGIASTEGRRRGKDELLFDDAAFGVILGQFTETLIQRMTQKVQLLA